MRALDPLRVVDASSGIAGPYCSRLFADAGADVVRLEPEGGDPLRRWSATGADLRGRDGALFRYLDAGKRSVTGALDRTGDPEVAAWIDDADLLIEDASPTALDRDALRARHPGLVWLSITPFGLSGPMAGRPASDFTLQAEGGSIGARGRPGQEPYQAGGRVSAWAGGCFAAVAALAALRRARRTGFGCHVDVSLLETTAIVTNCYLDLMWGILGRPPITAPLPNIETPSIEPTRDGYVGFTTYSAQQMSDFLILIGRPDLRESGEFSAFAARLVRLEEWERVVHAYTRAHDTEEIIRDAQLLRIPVAPVQDGRSVLAHEQVRAREAFVPDPSGGFLRPAVPYRIDGARPAVTRPAPAAGEHTGRVERRDPRRPAPSGGRRLPLEGVRVIDATTWWAGPMATDVLAVLGADVVKLESPRRIDGARSVGGTFSASHAAWWECSFIFLSANTNKRGLAVDLSDPRGMEIFERLVRGADALVENFSPRVMDGFGVDWKRVRALNPRCHYLRMPAFGLDGPWSEHVGFAATMEQMSGLSWITGHVADQPRIQRGPCDPIAGMHAAFALLAAMALGERSGRGHFVECAMLEGALAVTAEQVAEYTAYGNVMERSGNRSPEAAPQGLYPCRGHDLAANPQWLALSVESDDQWHALVRWLGRPDWAASVAPGLAARHARHDAIDAELRPVFATRDRDATVHELLAAGIPAAPVVDPRALAGHPQLRARGFHEELDHPVVGRQATMGVPFRFDDVPYWLHRAAPTLGQHNAEILAALGYDEAAIHVLADDGVIGNWPEGAPR